MTLKKNHRNLGVFTLNVYHLFVRHIYRSSIMRTLTTQNGVNKAYAQTPIKRLTQLEVNRHSKSYIYRFLQVAKYGPRRVLVAGIIVGSSSLSLFG